MKTFSYTARSQSGEMVEGVAEANNREEAIRRLRDDGLIVSKMTENQGTKDIDLKLGNRKAKEKSLAIMCNQFAILLQAGLPITRTLQLIAEQTEDKTLAEILRDAADDVAAGYGLASSLANHGDGLPPTFVESIRAGEESGALEVVFQRLSNYYEKQSRTKAKVKSALIYPIFVMVIAVVVVAIIMIFAVPVFKDSFAAMGDELPFFTQLVIDMSDFWVHWWWLVAAFIIAAVIGIKVAKKNETFHLAWSKLGIELPWGMKTPVLGRINLMNAASQYSGTISVMMSAGLPIVKAMGVTARSLTNYYMATSLEKVLPKLEAGKTLASALKDEDTLPALAIEMTAVGEQTGALEHTMEVISEYYDNEVETASARAMSLLEPIIICVLAVIVFCLLLAVYLPMFSLYGGMAAS